MSKSIKKLFSLVLAGCMTVGMCVSASAARISSCLNDNLVLNVYTWDTPAAGNRVSLWADEGHSEQRWTLYGTSNKIYIRSNANSNVTVACAGDNSAVMENYNVTYGDWQQHRIYYGAGTVRQFANKGTSYGLLLRVNPNAGSGSLAYYGDINFNESTDVALSWKVV